MRKTILILASLFACLVMTAGEVTEQEALETAKQVLRGRTVSSGRSTVLRNRVRNSSMCLTPTGRKVM